MRDGAKSARSVILSETKNPRKACAEAEALEARGNNDFIQGGHRRPLPSALIILRRGNDSLPKGYFFPGRCIFFPPIAPIRAV